MPCFSIARKRISRDEYREAVSEARSILSQLDTPKSAYSSTCKLCHWYSYCLKQLEAADDLTLIPYLGRSKRDALQAEFQTISDLASINPEAFVRGGKTVFKGIGPDTLKTLHARAKLLKQTHPVPYLKEAISFPVRPRELFFDIECDPMRDICPGCPGLFGYLRV